MRMLRWMCEVHTEPDKKRDNESWGNRKESPGKEVEVVWAYIMRREAHYVGRRAMEMKVQGRRKR